MAQKFMLINAGGKLIFSGEYALLNGGIGVVGCFNEPISFRMNIQETQTKDAHIVSERFGEAFFSLEEDVPKAFQLFQKAMKILNLKKVRIEIKNSKAFQGGFGTSGACIVALCAFSMRQKAKSEQTSESQQIEGRQQSQSVQQSQSEQQIQSKQQSESGCAWKEALFQESIRVLKGISSSASGVDIASLIYGGILSYDPKNKRVRPLDASFLSRYRVLVVDSGYKTSTDACIEIIKMKHSEENEQAILQKISNCSVGVENAIARGNVGLFEALMNENNAFLNELGVCDDTMTLILNELKRLGAKVAKISGSGLGDCILGFFDKEIPFYAVETSALSEFSYKEVFLMPNGVEVFDE